MNAIDWTQTEKLFEKNLRFIESSQKIHTDISKLHHLNEDDYRILACEDGKGFTIEKKTEKGFVRMHSAYEPYREGKLLADALMTEENKGKTFVRFGLGFGYMLHYLAPFAKENNCEIVIYEPSYDVFNYFIRLFDISKLFKGYPIRLFVYEGSSEIYKVFPYAKDLPLATADSYGTLGYFNFYNSEILKCTDAIVQFFHSDLIQRNTGKYFNIDWAKHSISNLPYIFKGYGMESLMDTLKGKPAVLVAAGPSLNKNVHLLKEIQGKVFMVAVYSAFKTLEAHNIKPDMYMIVDAFQPYYPCKEDYPFSDIPLAILTIVNEKIFSNHKENNFIYLSDDPSTSSDFARILLKGIGRNIRSFASPGGSVAHLLASMLKFMGVSAIITIGLDLSYPSGSQTHAKEAFDGLEIDKAAFEEEIAKRDKVLVEDVFGNMIETDKALSSFIDSFATFAKKNLKNFEMIDATEGGAKIKHTKIMPLREAIDTYMSECTNHNFTKELIAKAKANGFVFDKNEQETVLDILDKLYLQCNNVLALNNEALEKAEKVLKLYRFNKIPTPKELVKPFAAFRKCIDEIVKNELAHEILTVMWVWKIQEDLAFKREEEPEELFYTRGMIYMLQQQKSGATVLVKTLEETIGKMKEERR